MRGKVGLTQKIVGSQTLRTVFSILFILNTILLSCAVMSFAYLRDKSFYTTGAEAYRSEIFDSLMKKSSNEALIYFQCYFGYNQHKDTGESYEAAIQRYKEEFLEKNSNFFFSFKKKDAASQNETPIFDNYTSEIGRSYYPDSKEFFDQGEITSILLNRDPEPTDEDQNRTLTSTDITFEGHLKKTLTANDVYRRVALFFYFANILKYFVFALMILFAVFEFALMFVQYAAAGHTAMTRKRDLDQIPMYLLIPFLLMYCALCIYFLQRQTGSLTDLEWVFSKPIEEVRPALYLFFLLLLMLATMAQMLLTTVSVRLHRPLWWRRSILYRAFASRTFGQRTRTVLTIMIVLQLTLYVVLNLIKKDIEPPGIVPWIYLAADAAFIATLLPLLYVLTKDMSQYIPKTHLIATEGRGSVPTDGLSDSAQKHAKNINFLSRSAYAETEKRFINENFSTELIHSVSNGLREPLNAVAENVRMLESGRLDRAQSRDCVDRILSLSQELKKTIEDMILISKASTGNLPFEPVPTDTGMMLSQAVGEFDAQFAQANVEPVTEQPDEPLLILADGQYMWYVFEGILSVMLENAVAGTRLFLRADRAGEKAVIVFRCTVHAEARQQIRELSGMGLSSAKVFTILQGGFMAERLSHDTLTAVLQFPAIAADASE